MEVQRYIDDIEQYTNSLKVQLEEDKRELKESQKRFMNLLSAFCQEELSNAPLNTLDHMKCSAPGSSVIASLFKNDLSEGLILTDSSELKKKRLAEERKAEYNAYLLKKEAELLSKRKQFTEKKSATPKSILESVDYERVLAKRKEEELKFRNLNYAEPNWNLSASMGQDLVLNERDQSPEIYLHRIQNNPKEVAASASNFTGLNKNEPVKYPLPQNPDRNVPSRSNSRNQELQSEQMPIFRRTGGGGEPVRDSFGNLITARGYKRTNALASENNGFLSSVEQYTTNFKTSSYREELRKQIEEKKRLEEMEKEKARQLEERIAQRIEEQRLQMLQEYENELKKNNKKKEDIQRQQERAQKLEEFQRKDAEMRKRKFEELRASERSQEAAVNERISSAKERSHSPPVPAVRTKEILEKVAPSSASALREVKPENVFSSLAEIRRKLMQDQQKKDTKHSYEVMNRQTVQDVSDDEDNIIEH